MRYYSIIKVTKLSYKRGHYLSTDDLNVNNKALVQFSGNKATKWRMGRQHMSQEKAWQWTSLWSYQTETFWPVVICRISHLIFWLITSDWKYGKRKKRDERAILTVLKRGNDSVGESTCCPYTHPSLVPSISIWWFTTICNSFQKIWKPPLISASISTHIIHINSCRHMHINNKRLQFSQELFKNSTKSVQ